MEREAIERLAIDSAAGELNQDAEALLRTYLAEHSRANEWAGETLRVYEKTEAAINAKTTGDYASGQIRSIKANRLLQINWTRLARWAAVVMFGTFIGFAAGRWEIGNKASRIALPESGRAPGRIETVSDLKEKYAGTFWGDKMLALLEHRPGKQYKANLQGVRFWDKYKQYIKEKQYE